MIYSHQEHHRGFFVINMARRKRPHGHLVFTVRNASDQLQNITPHSTMTSQLSFNSEKVFRVHAISAKLKPEILAVTLKTVVNRLIPQLQLFLLIVSLCLDFCSTLISMEQRYWGAQLGFSKALSGPE